MTTSQDQYKLAADLLRAQGVEHLTENAHQHIREGATAVEAVAAVIREGAHTAIITCTHIECMRATLRLIDEGLQLTAGTYHLVQVEGGANGNLSEIRNKLQAMASERWHYNYGDVIGVVCTLCPHAVQYEYTMRMMQRWARRRPGSASFYVVSPGEELEWWLMFEATYEGIWRQRGLHYVQSERARQAELRREEREANRVKLEQTYMRRIHQLMIGSRQQLPNQHDWICANTLDHQAQLLFERGVDSSVIRMAVQFTDGSMNPIIMHVDPLELEQLQQHPTHFTQLTITRLRTAAGQRIPVYEFFSRTVSFETEDGEVTEIYLPMINPLTGDLDSQLTLRVMALNLEKALEEVLWWRGMYELFGQSDELAAY